ncbi:hypothetical protein C6341_g10455 [Phytophthora cactorum]|nr:hypothetical protein PC122_g8799 [Phytophthora cactorum]KAG3171695.1 hypothetical protein C6341_g10455 [Phytophthora cactorum]
MPAQVKAFFDSCGSLCATGALVGKTGGLFFSTGLVNMDEMHGGSPCAGTLAKSGGSRQPSELELALATTQGKSFAQVTKKLAA